MAATLVDSFTLANDATWKQKVAMAAARVATTVKGEQKAAVGKERVEIKRQSLADIVLHDALNATAFIAVALAAQAGITGAETDASLVTMITNNWSLLAGVTPTEL